MSGAYIAFEGMEGAGKSTCAKEVYDALVKEGVSKDQLELKGFGGSGALFNFSAKPYLSRTVILEDK